MYNPWINNQLDEQRYSINRLAQEQKKANYLYAKAHGLEKEWEELEYPTGTIKGWLHRRNKKATVDSEYMGTFFND